MGCICGKDNVVIQGQKFNLIRQVGEGCIIEFSNNFNLVVLFFRSFSYVYEASNTADTHRYAVKKMSCHTNEEEKRARDEVENYQRFSHQNLGGIINIVLIQ
jgi:hypothetical protein